jgi:hypothetical protein
MKCDSNPCIIMGDKTKQESPHGKRVDPFYRERSIKPVHLEKKGVTVNEMAKRLGKHKSSIYNELSRNSERKVGYLPDRAHDKTLKRRANQIRKLDRNPKGMGRFIMSFYSYSSPLFSSLMLMDYIFLGVLYCFPVLECSFQVLE